MILLVEGSPVAAVNEHQCGSRPRRGKQIERLLRSPAVAQVEDAREALPSGDAVGGPAREPLRMVRKRRPEVVFALDEVVGAQAHAEPGGGSMQILSSPSDSMRPTRTSPGETAATPAGVPVKMRSPGSSS